MSVVTVTDSRWDGRLFLQSDVMFEFFSDVHVEVSCIDVDFAIMVVILLGQRVEEFFNLTFARAHIHASDVNWARKCERIVHDTAWCEDPLAPSVIWCCSIFRFAILQYRIATHPYGGVIYFFVRGLLLLPVYFIRCQSLFSGVTVTRKNKSRQKKVPPAKKPRYGCSPSTLYSD